MATGFLSLFSPSAYAAAPPAPQQGASASGPHRNGTTPILAAERGPPPSKRARTTPADAAAPGAVATGIGTPATTAVAMPGAGVFLPASAVHFAGAAASASATTNATAPSRQPVVVPAATIPPIPGRGTYAARMDQKSKLARREKNREHARRSRARKMEQQDALEAQARELREENARLRALVKNRLPEKAAGIIGECCYRQPLPDLFHGSSAGGIGGATCDEAAEEQDQDVSTPKRRTSTSSASPAGGSGLLSSDFDLIERLTATGQSFVLTDPRLPDNPIVYASESFLELTGYGRDKVLGRNARFLQGPDTDGRSVAAVREAVKGGRDATSTLLNYKADGTTFWNEFWVAALRNRRGKIVNYVGVQCAVDPPDKSESSESKPAAAIPQEQAANLAAGHHATSHSNLSPAPIAAGVQTAAPVTIDATSMENIRNNTAVAPQDDAGAGDDFDTMCDSVFDDGVGELDWAVLAETLEADYKDAGEDEDLEQMDDGAAPGPSAADSDEGADDAAARNYEIAHRLSIGPTRAFVTKTVRSELIDCLVSSHGDVTTPRFASALDILSSIYAATSHCDSSFSDLLHGSWRSLSRPSYPGCLGTNAKGNFVYTLGKMSFNMFQPGNLRCSVQQTLNDIKPVCKMDGAPAAAPWSLRRELALRDQDDPNAASRAQVNTMLKSYDIAVALTIEPGQFKARPKERIPSPSSRLRALKVVQGYFLPDPDTPNRLTVWFTGGKLTPAPRPEPRDDDEFGYLKDDDIDEKEYGNFDEWKKLFGTIHKRTWGESFSVMGAKLLFGAELSDGMEKDGTVRYTLHRPHGGHGKAYVDVLYLDDEVLITRGNAGTIHVMTRNSTATVTNTVCSAIEVSSEAQPSNSVTSVAQEPASVSIPSTACNVEKRGEKRKAIEGADQENVETETLKASNGNTVSVTKTPQQSSVDFAGSSGPNAGHPSKASGPEEIHHAADANQSIYNLPPVVQSNQSQRANDGVTNIMSSVEAFFGGGFF